MRPSVATAVLSLALLGVGAGLILLTKNAPSSPAAFEVEPSPAETFDPARNSNGDAFSRSEAEQPAILGNPSLVQNLTEPAWLRCLELPDYHDCLEANAPLLASAKDIALVVERYGRRDPRAMDFALLMLPKVPPTEAAGITADLFLILGNNTEAQVFIESVAHRMKALEYPWIHLVAQTLSPADLYSSDRSAGAVILASSLTEIHRGLYDQLEQGALGMHGGTREQIYRSILGCLSYHSREKDLQGSISVLRAIADSPTGFEDPFTGCLIAAYAISPGFRPIGESTDCVAIISALLGRVHMREAVAKQLYAELQYRPPQGISEKDWSEIVLTMRSILPHEQ